MVVKAKALVTKWVWKTINYLKTHRQLNYEWEYTNNLPYKFVVKQFKKWIWNCHMNNNVLLVIIVNKVGNGKYYQAAQIIKQREFTHTFEKFTSLFISKILITGWMRVFSVPASNHVHSSLAGQVCVFLFFCFNLRVKWQFY